jgi:hypothetical protein
MVGRGATVLLMAALVGPAAGPWAAASGTAPGCSDGVCVCAHHGPARAAKTMPCHGHGETGAPKCEMRAACHHEIPGVAVSPPYLLPAMTRLALERPSADLVPGAQAQPRAGLRPVETQPPRAS